MRQEPSPPLFTGRPLWFLWGGVVGLLLLTSACAIGAGPTPMPEGRVGLVVRHSDGRVETACVPYSGDVTGEDVLLQSGLEVRMDMANALGSLVCSIDGEGCAFPEESCLCECDQPGACGYWAYFGWDAARNSWIYNALGARARRLTDGDLDAWVWLESTGPDAVAAALPEGMTFEGVCETE